MQDVENCMDINLIKYLTMQNINCNNSNAVEIFIERVQKLKMKMFNNRAMTESHWDESVPVAFLCLNVFQKK